MIFGEKFYPTLDRMTGWRQSLFALVLATRQFDNFKLWTEINNRQGSEQFLKVLKQYWTFHLEKYNEIDLEGCFEEVAPFIPTEEDELTGGDGARYAFDACIALNAVVDAITIDEKSAKIASKASMSSVIRLCESNYEDEELTEETLLDKAEIENEISFQVELMELVGKPRSFENMIAALQLALESGTTNLGLESTLSMDDFKAVIEASELSNSKTIHKHEDGETESKSQNKNAKGNGDKKNSAKNHGKSYDEVFAEKDDEIFFDEAYAENADDGEDDNIDLGSIDDEELAEELSELTDEAAKEAEANAAAAAKAAAESEANAAIEANGESVAEVKDYSDQQDQEFGQDDDNNETENSSVSKDELSDILKANNLHLEVDLVDSDGSVLVEIDDADPDFVAALGEEGAKAYEGSEKNAESNERDDRRHGRGEGYAQRGERGGRFARDGRGGRGEGRGERGERGGRFSRDDRGGRGEHGGRFSRDDRGGRGEGRAERGGRFSRDDRGGRGEGRGGFGGKGRFNRDEKRDSAHKKVETPRGADGQYLSDARPFGRIGDTVRSSSSTGGRRFERAAGSDRGDRSARGDRGPRGGFGRGGDRSERGSLGERGDRGYRGGFGRGGERSERGERGERGSSGGFGRGGERSYRDDRGGRGDRGSRGGFIRDAKGERSPARARVFNAANTEGFDN